MSARPSFHSRLSAAVSSVVTRDRSAAPPQPVPDGTREAPARGRGPKIAVGVLLALILGAGLWIRLRHNGYGLPFVYNYDESEHFTSRAVKMFGGDLDPGYYQNPSGYTYLMYVGLRAWFAVLGLGHLQFGVISKQFAIDPTPIWTFARSLTALIAIAGVAATFWTAWRVWGARVGLVAAALLAFAFLPVTYSRIAVTDVGTFLPVAIAIWAILRAYEDGRLRHYLIAGAAIGFAVGFKYTVGLALIPLLIAGLVRFFRDRERPLRKRRDLPYLVAAILAMVVAFAITTPYFFVHPGEAFAQLKDQAQAAGSTVKLGQGQQGGISYYLESFTWGFGWAAIAAALVGVVFEFRRNRMRTLLLVIFPVVLFVYMGVQTRYFGRWLLMIYPLLAMLAGIGIVGVATLIRDRVTLSARAGWALSGGLAALITLLVLIQPLVHDWHTSEVLGRKDTQQIARSWLIGRYDDSLRVVIEPAVPDIYFRKVGKENAVFNRFTRGFTNDLRRAQLFDAPLGADTTYASGLSPDLIDLYRSHGFCLVMTNSLIRGRAENAKVPAALAYYERLKRESKLIFHRSPFKHAATPVPLHYDFSYDYYPSAYRRPGGIVNIYKLDHCQQQYGRVPERPFGFKGLQKGVGTSLPPS
jgi:4-amino-4-deoxy-L-arabinose transferase-like glycosyltransferase